MYIEFSDPCDKHLVKYTRDVYIKSQFDLGHGWVMVSHDVKCCDYLCMTKIQCQS